MTAAHTERETLKVDVNIPTHADRVTTTLFRHTRDRLIQRQLGQCWICGADEKASGHPLEAHHYPIERSLAELIDWPRFIGQAKAGDYGPYVAGFDWDNFDPVDPYSFVDDMTANGLLLCKAHHIGADEGIHALPHPLWIAQRAAKEGYRFNSVEIIHHAG